MLRRLYPRRFSQFNIPEISSQVLDGPRKVMLYRARQRGWLELDVILGSFADKNLAKMTVEEVNLFGEVLGQENPDLFKYLSGQLPPSPELMENRVFQQILSHVNKSHPSM